MASIFVSVFALYFFTRSPGLDEWDSVQFAMGVHDFDLWRHRPHPPGYPLYIFFGWVGQVLFGWGPEFSLHMVGCLGGALFVTAWFLIVRRQFSTAFAWLIAGTLAITPIVWMTATKVLSDSLAAGLLSVELLCALFYRRSGRVRDLIFTGVIAAAAVGARPQLIAVAIAILFTPLWQRRAGGRAWLIGMTTFVAGCFVWLIPMWYLQWKLRPEVVWWQVYPELIYTQWRWRLDKPIAYIGAGEFSAAALLERFVSHILGWFQLGLGFAQSTPVLAMGIILTAGGLASYFVCRPKGDVEFWKIHGGWAGLYILIVFCFLPWDQRYYLPIFPLLLIAITLGIFRLPGPWKLLSLLWPLLLLFISVPLAIANHHEDPPPIRFVRYLQTLHPRDERQNVLLVLRESARHAQWYAPEFAMRFDAASLLELNPSLLAQVKTIYTDDRNLMVGPDRRLVPLKTFERSELISPKQNRVELYQVEWTSPELGHQSILKKPGEN